MRNASTTAAMPNVGLLERPTVHEGVVARAVEKKVLSLTGAN